MAFGIGRFGKVPLTMIRPGGDPVPDWQRDLKTVEFHIPGSNTVVVQAMGQGLLTLEVTLRLDSDDDLEAFLSLLGTKQTLRVPFHATYARGDVRGEYLGELYKDFTDVIVTECTRIIRHMGGSVTCDVTFKRAVPT